MFGKNAKLPFENSDGRKLNIHSIFSTIQGEGVYSGHQAIFIRLSGCNLACTFCDTDFDLFESLGIDEISKKVAALRDTANLVVITGGEPFRQNIRLLCESFLNDGLKVQIESNGTLYTDIPKNVEIVCSPKISNGKYYTVREDVLKQTIALKFLISRQNEWYSDIAEVGQTKHNIPVYLQPMDEYSDDANINNIELTKKLAKKYNAIFSLQLHKIINVE